MFPKDVIVQKQESTAVRGLGDLSDLHSFRTAERYEVTAPSYVGHPVKAALIQHLIVHKRLSNFHRSASFLVRSSTI